MRDRHCSSHFGLSRNAPRRTVRRRARAITSMRDPNASTLAEFARPAWYRTPSACKSRYIRKISIKINSIYNSREFRHFRYNMCSANTRATYTDGEYCWQLARGSLSAGSSIAETQPVSIFSVYLYRLSDPKRGARQQIVRSVATWFFCNH